MKKALPAPTVTTQNGELVTVDGLEAFVVSGALESEGEELVIYRLKQELVIDVYGRILSPKSKTQKRGNLE